MKKLLFLGALVFGLFVMMPADAGATDTCHARCNCAPSEVEPSGGTKGCISPAHGTVAVCGNAGAAPAQGCVCVGSTCLNNMGSGANTVSQGCPNTVPCN